MSFLRSAVAEAQLTAVAAVVAIANGAWLLACWRLAAVRCVEFRGAVYTHVRARAPVDSQMRTRKRSWQRGAQNCC